MLAQWLQFLRICKVQEKDYVASQMMIMQLPKGINSSLIQCFLKHFGNLLLRNIQMQLITL